MNSRLSVLLVLGLVASFLFVDQALAVRTAITVQTAKGPYVATPVAADSLDYTYSAGDNVNGNYFVATGRELVLVRNTAGGAGTITFTSVADERGRKGDITTYSVGAGEFAMYWFGALTGWAQTGSQIYIDTSASTMTIAVIRIP
jgi:hypothetical protein